ncbi:MAG: U32 family peptidase [Promethearchaeia archaeon]
MKLSVPTNFDPKFLNKIKKYPVYEIYGSLSSSVLGGVLPAPFLPEVNKKILERTVEKAHKLNFKFNYILNSSCSGNIENTKKGMKKIKTLLKWLSDIGVDTITVGLPYLIDYIKNNFPNLKIKASLICYINTLQKARFFKRMGVNEITVDINQNRNFKLLTLLKKELNIKISLLVNNLCLWECPYAFYHSTSSSHSFTNKGYYNNYCEYNCRLIKTEDPVEMIKARWIRPEDIEIYEKIGIKYFKIGGRTQSTDFLIRTIDAYSNRKYDGNLLDILNTYQESKKSDSNLNYFERLMKDNINKIPGILLKILFYGFGHFTNHPYKKIAKMLAKMPPSLIKANIDLLNNPYVPYIDNKKLEGFIEHFKKIDCYANDCNKCGHCEKYAKIAISFPEKEQYSIKLKRVIDLINRR